MIQRVIHLEMKGLLERAESGEGIELDRDRTSALVNLQRTASGILDQFPGLLQARKGDGAKEGDEGIALEEVLAALELPPLEDPSGAPGS
jgi:hypothetical protein